MCIIRREKQVNWNWALMARDKTGELNCQTLMQYVLMELFGKGTFGGVYLACDQEVKRFVRYRNPGAVYCTTNRSVYLCDAKKLTDLNAGWSRVLRGGSWYYDGDNLRAANRGRDYPVVTWDLNGFRCARSP
ncbi:hypothetical protein D6833_12935 [Candidatus Parcubacteria bacterium]|nr:MAG: hypothetical protein D6833_12935 [Candidatus Parcubacteria bacterium]